MLKRRLRDLLSRHDHGRANLGGWRLAPHPALSVSLHPNMSEDASPRGDRYPSVERKRMQAF
jgi:hypothetical protein